MYLLAKNVWNSWQQKKERSSKKKKKRKIEQEKKKTEREEEQKRKADVRANKLSSGESKERCRESTKSTRKGN